ncbi:MAG: dethiobiotin synthase [Pseudazoarcus pumilus]|nr:dethiobiotin synthase [Pseudazoarcus pumilus]
MGKAWFVTGTDTGIGKTFVTCALLRGAAARGLRAVGMKPVAAGTERINGRIINEDTARLMAAASLKADERLVTQYCLQAPIAPHLAAREEGVQIDFSRIDEALHALQAQADRVFVEGAGGLLVPLDEQRDYADLAVALKLPVILVVGMRLGCINHALLSVTALQVRGLTLAGWVANRIDPAMLRFEDNLQSLRERIAAPLLGVVGHGEEEAAIDLDQGLAAR